MVCRIMHLLKSSTFVTCRGNTVIFTGWTDWLIFLTVYSFKFFIYTNYYSFWNTCSLCDTLLNLKNLMDWTWLNLLNPLKQASHMLHCFTFMNIWYRLYVCIQSKAWLCNVLCDIFDVILGIFKIIKNLNS